MESHSEQTAFQTAAPDPRFQYLLNRLSEVHADANNVSKRIAHIRARLQEFDSHQSIPGAAHPFAVKQDLVNGDTQGLPHAETNQSKFEAASPLDAIESKSEDTKHLDGSYADGQIERVGEPSTFNQTYYHAQLLPPTVHSDDIDTRACKLVHDTMLGRVLLGPTDHCDAETWLRHLAKTLLETGTAARPARLCLHVFADILDPSTFTRLKCFDENSQAEDKAKADAMLFCIQLFISHSEVGKVGDSPVDDRDIPPNFVFSIAPSLAAQKARCAALKDPVLRKGIEEGEKLFMLRQCFGRGIIHLISTKTWLDWFHEMTIDNMACIYETTRNFLPELCNICERLVRRSESVSRAITARENNRVKYSYFEDSDDSMITNGECSMQMLLSPMESCFDSGIE